MANVLNRITKKYLRSVNTPDFSVADWIINPIFVPNCELKYIVVEDNNIREMTLEEKTIIDYIPPPEPKILTLEEIEKDRTTNIANEIALKYSPADEIAFLRKLITGESRLTDVDIMKWLEVVATAKANYPKVQL